jgi:hypothetical protein
VSIPDAIFRTRWEHVFEEDGPDGAVYRPDDVERPRSRRPRTRVSLSPDGRARLLVPGPDDRLREVEARWQEEDGEITVSGGGGPQLRIHVQSEGCLLVSVTPPEARPAPRRGHGQPAI